MNRIRIYLLVLLLPAAPAAPAAEPAAPTYERDIRPLLRRRCTVCHNARKKDVPDVSGGLALDSYDSIQAGTSEHRVVVSGKASQSELTKRLADPDEDRRMPLSEEPLAAADQDLIRRWIDAGLPRAPAVVAAKPAARQDKMPPEPVAVAPRTIRWRRSLDITLPLDLKLPNGTAGIAKGGPVRIVARLGPLPPVSAMAFRGDGRLLAAGTYGQIVLWDIIDAQPIATIGDLPGPIHALEFSRDGKRLAVGSGVPARTGVVRVYAVPGGELLHDFTGHGDVVFDLAFRADGGQLASASFDQSIRLWSLATGKAEGTFSGHSDFVEAIVYTKDGGSILSAGKDRTIKRIDVRSLKELRTYSSHNDEVLSLAVHPDGLRFVSTGNEPQLRWWNLDSSKPTKIQKGHQGPVHQLAFSRDGRRLISASGDGSTRIWDGATGVPIRSLKGTTQWQYAAAISDDGRLAAAGGWDGLIHLWDAESGKLRGTLLQVPVNPSASSEEFDIDWLVLTPEGYFSGSPAVLGLARGWLQDTMIPDALMREACLSPEQTTRVIRGDAVPPIKFGQGVK
jgi:hypothetical protein